MDPLRSVSGAIATLALLSACGGDDYNHTLPQLGMATGASLISCTDLTTRASFANTTFTAASAVAAGTLGGVSVPAHCQLTGHMFDRTSTVDGKAYTIGFEMRLPNAWNGRFFYQANGGTDGSVVTGERNLRRRPDDERARRKALPSSARMPATTQRRTRPSASTRRRASTTATRPSPS